MKATLFATLAIAALLTATSAFAAPFTQGPDHRNDNYGYAKGHRVTPPERARWEVAQRKSHKNIRKVARYGHPANYGYAQNHRVTPPERARWEANQHSHR